MAKVGVVGALGRMGKALILELEQSGKLKLSSALESPRKQEEFGKNMGDILNIPHMGVILHGEPEKMFEQCDIVIDFSHKDLVQSHCLLASRYDTKMILGTTGLDHEDHQAIDQASHSTAIVQAGNMSLGVNALLGLTEKMAEVLDEKFWDIEILEMHHKHKIDAPSGTALMLGEAAALGRNISLKEKQVFSREGIIGERESGEIGFATLRGGSVVGDHEVIFAGENEVISFSHKAGSRQIFAKGAIKAAEWIIDQPNGRYRMQDVLGL